MRVLLIEDDSATAQSIELMLKSESFNLYTTDLGEEEVDLGKIYDYDIILLDLNLPDPVGLRRSAQSARVKVKAPILILTGLAAIEDKVRGLGFGADDYLTKPFPTRTNWSRAFKPSCVDLGMPKIASKLAAAYRSRYQGRRGRGRACASDRQGIQNLGAPCTAQGRDAHQRKFLEPSLWRHG